MIVTSWGIDRTIQEWLADNRIHPEITYDVIRRRLKRGGELSIPEIALTTPVIKGAQKGDTKARTMERKRKAKERYKNFVTAQKVRERYNNGMDKADIKHRFGLTESAYQKIISNTEWWNIHWEACRPGQVPPHFEEIRKEVEDVYGAKDGLDSFEVKETK
jgi:hypothetical protein